MKRKLIDEVTVQEMQHMREEGMTNKQIAERLDCNYITVKRYLGKQPAGLRAAPGAYSARVKDVEKPAVKVVQAPKTDLMLSRRTEEYHGRSVVYTVYNGQAVQIKQGQDETGLRFDREGLQNLALELMDLLGRMENA